ncbi:DsrE family protein [Desulfotomaculum nigrificans]|uniref:DsrE family protein n=1 Tax=Desulfotomaculum nigrificans TaxID=1565 RepID=UPI0001FAF0EF|nr:DsrE family protein [Desulfotomaculum nigrificans]
MSSFKVLFHVSDNEIWPKALTNIRNFIKDVGPGGAEIEVVANAAAVAAYYNNEKADMIQQMAELAGQGVRFIACRNALKAHSLDENLRPSFVEVVPAGITEIVKKQSAGYAYIKP